MSTTGLSQVTAANLCDATNTKIANGTVWFQPVLNDGTPTNFRIGVNGGGQVIDAPVSASISAGGFTIALADTSLTTPVNIGYRVWATYPNGQPILGVGYKCFQPTGVAVNFDTVDPNLAPQITVQLGPQGLSAYQVYVLNGGQLSQSAWLASLVGPAGANGIASLPQLASVRAKLPMTANLYNVAAETAGKYVFIGDGTLSVLAGYVASDYMPANSGGQMIANFSTPGNSAGAVWYDSNQAFISDFQITAGTPFTAPTNAAWLRTSNQPSLATAMVVNGSTLPSGFKSFGSYSTSEVDAKFVAAAALVSQPAAAALTRAKLANSAPTNVFNAATFTTDEYINDATNPGVATPFATYGFGLSDYIPANSGGMMTANISLPVFNSQNVISRFDANLNYIPWGSAGPAIVANTPFAIDAATAFIRLAIPNADSASFMLCNGTALPANYQGFGITRPMRSPLFGKKFAVFGDSISQAPASPNWQYELSILTGATLGLSDARGGRQLAQGFECYGGGTGTGVNRFVTLAVDPVTQEPAGYQNTGTIGNTLAQDLLGHDLIFVVLGTNDYNGGASTVTVGNPSDSVTTASEYGYINALLTGLHTAAPHAQIVVVTPWLNAFEFTVLSSGLTMVQTIVNVLTTAAGNFGDKVVDMLKISGHNVLTTAYLTSDAGQYSGTTLGTHPSPAGHARWAAIIANAAEQLF